jgi:hypothetical protein
VFGVATIEADARRESVGPSELGGLCDVLAAVVETGNETLETLRKKNGPSALAAGHVENAALGSEMQ